jgi:hypothetical protein
MELPRPALPSASIDLAGTPVSYRSLSHGQAIKLDQYKAAELRGDAPAYIVACGLGITTAEAQDWLDSVTLELGQQLVDAILHISGLDERSPKA